MARLAEVNSALKQVQRNRCHLQIEGLEDRLVLDVNSAGPLGIDALGLGLTGQGIHLGQVDIGRPGLRGLDNNANSHPDVTPSEVFLQNRPAVANQNVDPHATRVAGVIIASGAGANRGFAQNVSLHSSANAAPNLTDYPPVVLSMQQVAMRNGGDVPAVNMSITLSPVPGAQLDGDSLLSQGLDYLAQQYNSLFVVAPANDRGTTKQIPADAYDGLVVAKAEQAGPTGQFRLAGTPAAVGANNRRLIDLLAPGENISVPEPTADGMGTYALRSGTSYAAPHATGTVALLQEYARDAGVVLVGGSIGQFVWRDSNGDGLQDPDEPGVPGIPVQLYTDKGALVATTTTDDDGHYLFSSVPPGDYYVLVAVPPDDPNFAFTVQHAGNDPDIDSDVDPSTGQTDTFTLALGDNQLRVADAGLVYSNTCGAGLSNGGFETGDFMCWSITGNTSYMSVADDNAHSGTYAASLGPIGSLGFLSQTVTTVPGQTYQLTFWLAHNRLEAGTPNEFQVSIGDNVVFDQQDMGIFDYTQYTFDYTATEATTTIQFGIQENPSFFDLDDVTFQMVG